MRVALNCCVVNMENWLSCLGFSGIFFRLHPACYPAQVPKAFVWRDLASGQVESILFFHAILPPLSCPIFMILSHSSFLILLFYLFTNFVASVLLFVFIDD